MVSNPCGTNLSRLAEHDFDAALLTHGGNAYSGAKAEFETLLADLGTET